MKIKFLIYIVFCLFLQSCFLISHKYKITNNYIKSNHAFYQGFQFSEIKVDSLDSLGIPVTFQRMETAALYTNASYNPKKTKKMYFYKPNPGYFWDYKAEFRIPILPIKMEKNSWYIIDGLVFFGNPTLSKFIYMDEKGKCHSYTLPHISNW